LLAVFCPGLLTFAFCLLHSSLRAHAASSSLSDRIKIMRNKAFPDVQISPQVLVNCDRLFTYGCHGGSATTANLYIYSHGVTDDSCMNYLAEDAACTDINICRNCDSNGTCFAVQNPKKWHISEFGVITGEAKMMAEIVARGPISCTIAVPAALENYSGGIFVDHTGDRALDHVISVVGFGVDEHTQVPYWIIRNSWVSQQISAHLHFCS
jgi:cathepsin X